MKRFLIFFLLGISIKSCTLLGLQQQEDLTEASPASRLYEYPPSDPECLIFFKKNRLYFCDPASKKILKCIKVAGKSPRIHTFVCSSKTSLIVAMTRHLLKFNIASGKMVNKKEYPGIAILTRLSYGRIAAGYMNGHIAILNNQTLNTYKFLEGHHGAVNAIIGLSDRKRLASIGEDQNVKFWGIESGTLLHSLRLPYAIPQYITQLANGFLLISGGDRLHILDPENPQALWDSERRRPRTAAVCQERNTERIMVGSDLGTIFFYERSGICFARVQAPGATRYIESLKLLGDGALIAGTADRVYIWLPSKPSLELPQQPPYYLYRTFHIPGKRIDSCPLYYLYPSRAEPITLSTSDFPENKGKKITIFGYRKLEYKKNQKAKGS